AQHVTARAEGAVVEMMMEVITPGKEPSIVPIKVQMTSDSARSLRAQLQPAITMAEVHQRRDASLPLVLLIHLSQRFHLTTVHCRMTQGRAGHATAAPQHVVDPLAQVHK